ncbi:MAG: TolC family protein [Bacillota bacterium]
MEHNICRTGILSMAVFVLLLGAVLPVEAASGGEDYDPGLISEMEGTVGLENFSEELIFEIVEFVRSRDPVLSSRREVIDFLDSDADGPAGEDSEEFPEYIRSTLQEGELDKMSHRQEVREGYTELERKLVSELLKKISEIFTYRSQIENQQELHDLLQTREETARRQVEAGLMEPVDLQEISEEIISVRNTISRAEINLQMLKMEIALNYGEEDWQELLQLLDRLEESLYE